MSTRRNDLTHHLLWNRPVGQHRLDGGFVLALLGFARAGGDEAIVVTAAMTSPHFCSKTVIVGYSQIANVDHGGPALQHRQRLNDLDLRAFDN